MKETRSLPVEIYTDEYYLTLCRGYEEFVEGKISPILLKSYELAAVKPGSRILDVGCGRGEILVKCAEAGCLAIGIDYSPDSISVARKYIEETTTPDIAENIKISKMNAKSIAFPCNSFDRVFLIDIVEHLYIEELNTVLNEVKRLIKPGGKVVIHTAPNAWLIQPIYRLAGLVFNWRKQPYHVNEQSILSLYRNLSLLGGSTKVWMSKVPAFFKRGVGVNTDPSSLFGMIAKVMDTILDGSLVTWTISHTPLKFVFGTDLWATVDIPVDEGGEM